METTQTSSLKKWILIAVAVAVVAIVVGVALRLWSSKEGKPISTFRDTSGGKQQLSVPLLVPETWKDAKGEVNIPKDITSPIEAVGQVTQVKGYESASSVRAFLGDDGQWYWEVQTPNGVMTVKGKAPSQ